MTVAEANAQVITKLDHVEAVMTAKDGTEYKVVTEDGTMTKVNDDGEKERINKGE
jgi:hypothetical protein